MNLLAVKAGVPDLFRRGQVELGEKLVIDVGELSRLRARLPRGQSRTGRRYSSAWR